MNAESLVARVYPGPDDHIKKYAETAIKASSYFVPPLYEEPQEEVKFGLGDRETTEPPETLGRRTSRHEGKPFIEIKFSKVPRSSNGVIFGCSTKSDVILPNLRDLSNFHFSLTFDEQKRFVVKDMGSLIGTEVTYNNKGDGTRRRFHWIVGGDKNAHRQKNVIIKIHENVQFEIVANEHDIKSQLYIENVEKFCQGSATAEGLFDDLNIPLRPDTEFATGAHTPGDGPIYVKRKIGKGGFGVAIHCWDVSTGDEYVIKRPSDKIVEKFLKKCINENAKLAKHREKWKDEANNMRKLVHPHIIKLFEVIDEPFPQLVMEYISEGPLSGLENITIDESMLVLTQCLSALVCMHENQLAHRDISPDNILVRSREPLHVVLADFGLAKNAEDLHTQCGTTPYAAPEIFEGSSIRYSEAVDVWSLGIVMCKILRILPSYSKHMQDLQQHVTDVSWCNMVVDSLGELHRRRPDSLKAFLLASMLVISPEGRNSARGCYNRVKALPDVIVGSKPSDRISDVLWRNATVVYAGDVDTNEQSTIRLKNAALVPNAGDTDDTDDDGQSPDGLSSIDSSSSGDRARRRSAAPPPSSRRSDARSNLKRPTAEMAPQSPGSKRRGRTSISQSHNFPGRLDPEVDQETAAIADLLQDLRDDAYRCDNLPDPSSESIPSWHPWNPFENRPFSWNNSTKDSNPDQTTTQKTTNAHEACEDRPCPRKLANEQERQSKTRDIIRCSDSSWSVSRILNASILGSPLARSQQHQSSVISHQASAAPRETAESRITKAAPVNDEDVNIPMTHQSGNPFTLPPCKSLPTLATTGYSVSEASHLSTREVLSDHRQPNVRYMVLRQYRVSMRTSDGQLHVGQILKARNVTGSQRDAYWHKLKTRGLTPPWVPFGDGVFVCQATGLSEELQPLLNLSPNPQPNPTENYFLNAPGFVTLAWEGHIIPYRPSERTINATSLLALSKKPREQLERFLQDNPWINAEECTTQCHQALDGLYIPSVNTEVLCSMLGIDTKVVGILENACLRKTIESEEPSAPLINHGMKVGPSTGTSFDDVSVKCNIRSYTWSGYLILSCDEKVIFFSADGYINFNHLAKLGNISGTWKEVIQQDKNKRVLRGRTPAAGTYIGRYAAKILCKHYEIDCRPVDHIGAFLAKNIQSTHDTNDTLTTKVNQVNISITKGCEWNLSALLKASVLSDSEQDFLLQEIQQAVQLRKEQQTWGYIYWIGFLEGLQVIRYTGIEEKLQHVISTVIPFRIPDEECLSIGGHQIYFTLRGEIHLPSIAKWGGLRKQTVRGGNGINGTFVPLVDAERYCRHHKLGLHPVEEVKKCLRARLMQSLKTVC